MTLAFALVLALAPPRPVDDVERSAEALVAAGRLPDALALLQDAYARDPQPRLLFALGVVHLELGDCPAAIDHMSRYLASEPGDEASRRAKTVVEYCDAKSPAKSTAAAPSAIVEPEPPPPSTPPPAEPEPATAAPPADDRRAWAHDPAGGALLGVGAGLGLLGGGLVIAGAVDRRRASDELDERSFDDRIDRARAFEIAGGIAAGVGAALLVGAVVRYVIVAKKGSRATARLARGGVLFGLRF